MAVAPSHTPGVLKAVDHRISESSHGGLRRLRLCGFSTVELDPKYCDVIIRRWQRFSGGAAVLDGDGRRFEEIAAGREAKAA